MREFSYTVGKALSSGLRPYAKRSRDFQIYELQNFKPSEFGLEPVDAVTVPVSEAALELKSLDDEVFPFPQLFIGKKNTYILGETSIYLVDPDNWNTLTEISTYNPSNPSATKNITAGGMWEFADYYDSVIFTNGTCCIFATTDFVDTSAWKYYVFDDTTIQTVIDYKGRVVFGGFDLSTFWGDLAESFLRDWYVKEVDTEFNPFKTIGGTSEIAPVYENFIWWSSAGGGDVMFLFLPAKVLETLYISSTYSASRPAFFDYLKMGTNGFAPMPVQGQVLTMRKAGDHLIVFSEFGVSAATAITSPSPTMSVVSLPLGGIAYRGAAASGTDGVVYVDNAGAVVKINNDLTHTILGYIEYVLPLIGSDLIVSFAPTPYENQTFGEYYITDGTDMYVLNKAGLFKQKQACTGVSYREGLTVSLGTKLTGTSNIEGKVGIDGNDFNLPGLKTLEWVRVDYDEAGSPAVPTLQVAVDYVHDVGGSYTSTGFKTVNKEGVVYFPVAFVRGRINIKVSNYANHSIRYVEVGLKHGDNRYKRHVQAGETIS